MERKAWICPQCNRSCAPHVDFCDCVADAAARQRVMPIVVPATPVWPGPSILPATPGVVTPSITAPFPGSFDWGTISISGGHTSTHMPSTAFAFNVNSESIQ